MKKDKSIINISEAELQAELKSIYENYTDDDFVKLYCISFFRWSMLKSFVMRPIIRLS